MRKANGTAVKDNSTQAQLANIAYRLDAKETELRSLDNPRDGLSGDIIHKRAVLRDQILHLREEAKLLEERLDLERADQTSREYAAKILRVRAILKRRSVVMQRLDEAIEIAGRAAKEIAAIDQGELAGEISGLDSYFPVQRGDYQQVALRKLAELGLGTDRRQDRGKAVPTLTADAQALHDWIIAELTGRPALLAKEREKQEAAMDEIRSVTRSY